MEKTFGQIADMWLLRGVGRLSPVTRERYEILLRKHILPAFKNRPADEITRGEVRAYLAALMKDGEQTSNFPADSVSKSAVKEENSLSSSVALSVLSVMQSVLRFAADEMGLNTCDVGGMKIPKKEKLSNVFSLKEQRCIEKKLLNDSTCTDHGILLSLYTGLKLGELCALRWGDVSEEDKTIHVHATVCRMKGSADAKIAAKGGNGNKSRIVVCEQKGAARDIPFPDILFKKYSEACLDKADFLLTGAKKPMDPRTLQYRFKRLLAECGIRDVPFTALRDTFAERCREAEVDALSFIAIFGHSEALAASGKYSLAGADEKRSAMEKAACVMAG